MSEVARRPSREIRFAIKFGASCDVEIDKN